MGGIEQTHQRTSSEGTLNCQSMKEWSQSIDCYQGI